MPDVIRRTLGGLWMIGLLAVAMPAIALDRTDPAVTAEAFVTAYKARDLAAMAELVNRTNEDLFRELAEQGETHRRYKSIFSGWRWEAGQKWSQASGETRYKGGDAVVFIAPMSGNEVAVVVLTFESGMWAVEDINSPSLERFQSLPTALPAKD